MILIVDDKPENLLSLKSVLKLNGLEVDTALSGEEALQKALKNHYVLIILDVQMRGMDGFEVAEALSGSNKTKDIPIIFLSAASTAKRFIAKGYASGAIDFVTKPADPDILLLKVKTFYKLYEQKNELTRIQKNLAKEIDERQNAEKNLQHTVQELHSIIESIPQIAFTTAPDGQIEFVNAHWFKYSNKISRFPNTYNNESLEKAWLSAINETDEPIEMEICIKEIESRECHYHLLRAFPVKDNSQKISKWVGTLTNIHLQKKTNEVLEKKVAERTSELQKTNDELETKNFELQQFTSVASHDLKEPLRKIRVFSSILKDRYLKDKVDALQYMERIINSSERMSGLINDLLDYSRLSLNEFFEKVDLNVVVNDILQDLELLVKEKNALVHIDHFPEIEAIPGQMRQLMQNLLSNSLKFTCAGIQPEVSVKCERIKERNFKAKKIDKGAFIKITVADNGIGFNEKYLDKIFTIFQRLNTNETYEGTGIGMAIVKKIVDKHSGIITANSLEGKGATFVIILPVAQEATEK